MDEDLTSDDQPGSDDLVFTYFAIVDKGDLMSPTHRKPVLRSLLISATVGDALLALKRFEERYLSVWICDHSSEEKPDFVPLPLPFQLSNTKAASFSSRSLLRDWFAREALKVQWDETAPTF
ncbi:hypothetical protein NE237_001623 [Protea cynaroides]|uniref:Uncharacterized protein n=1 Tax=Protea cynaroides TaxID=273540 RepID=A0A9Q0KTP7_9MAGN|nr:hypothetical protein NE237_001623 [Protea cynaroides]